MPFIAVPGCTECSIRYQNGTNLYQNVIHYRWTSSTPTGPLLNALAAAVANGVGAKLRDCVSSGWVFREVVCKNLNVENGAQGTYTWPSGTTGMRGGFQVAANEACGIVKRTGLAGYGQHGRMSVSGFVEGDVDGNTVGSSLIGSLIALGVEMLVSYVSGQFGPALARKRPRVGTPSAVPITNTAVLDSNIDSQKTRLNAHGR